MIAFDAQRHGNRLVHQVCPHARIVGLRRLEDDGLVGGIDLVEIDGEYILVCLRGRVCSVIGACLPPCADGRRPPSIHHGRDQKTKVFDGQLACSGLLRRCAMIRAAVDESRGSGAVRSARDLIVHAIL